MLTNLIGLGLVTGEVFNGLGRHMYYLSSDHRKRFQILGWLDWIQTFISIGCQKISICYFLLRINNSRRNYVFMYTLIAVNVLLTAVIIFLFLGICQPLHAHWDVSVNGKCFSNKQVEVIIAFQGAFSAALDIILSSIPWFFLRRLQISRHVKWLLLGLMSAGLITAVCSIIRTVLSDRVLDSDITWAMLTNTAWRTAEVNLGILCANAPVARPLYLYLRGRLQPLEYPSYPSNEEPNQDEGAQQPPSFWELGRRSGVSKGSRATEEQIRKNQGMSCSMPSSGQRTASTLTTSVEVELPIQGYVLGTSRRDSFKMDLEKVGEGIDQLKGSQGETASSAEQVGGGENTAQRERQI
ncbi:MAG: hypothetical protein Q9190_004038 [Brigantiaea leucoxantha]